MKQPGYFGPGVIGTDRAAKEAIIVKTTGKNRFGPAVTGQKRINPLPETVKTLEPPAGNKPVEETLPSLSVSDLDAALLNNPALLDLALAAEFQRPGGPRKGALDLLEFTEQARDGGPRPEVLEQISKAR